MGGKWEKIDYGRNIDLVMSGYVCPLQEILFFLGAGPRRQFAQ